MGLYLHDSSGEAYYFLQGHSEIAQTHNEHIQAHGSSRYKIVAMIAMDDPA